MSDPYTIKSTHGGEYVPPAKRRAIARRLAPIVKQMAVWLDDEPWLNDGELAESAMEELYCSEVDAREAARRSNYRSFIEG